MKIFKFSTKTLLVLAVICGQYHLALSQEQSTGSGLYGQALGSFVGCCSDPDIKPYGNSIDFTSQGLGVEITNQFFNLGVLFGRGASPFVTSTVVTIDGDRPLSCINKQCLSGQPNFSGQEFFMFRDPVQNKWAGVQKVGVSIGVCNNVGSCFIAAYAVNAGPHDPPIAIAINKNTGFQFLSIERASADIGMVWTGDWGDPWGSAINCVTFSTPVVTNDTLPDTLIAPSPEKVPSLSPWGLAVLFLLIVASIRFVWLRRRQLSLPAALVILLSIFAVSFYFSSGM